MFTTPLFFLLSKYNQIKMIGNHPVSNDTTDLYTDTFLSTVQKGLTLDSEYHIKSNDPKYFTNAILLHYTIVFPIVLFCLISTIRLLKRMRCLSQADSQELIEDIEKTGN